MSKRLSSDDNRAGDHPLLGMGHSRHPPEGTASGQPKETAVWWTTPQHHSATLSRNLTRECYPVVSHPSSKIGGPEGFAPIPSSGEQPCEGKLHRSGFSYFLCFENVLRNKGFYGGRSANPATNLLIRCNPTAGGRPQTQFGTRYGLPLVHKELLHPLTGFVFNPAGCRSKHRPHQVTWWGRRFIHRQPDHATG